MSIRAVRADRRFLYPVLVALIFGATPTVLIPQMSSTERYEALPVFVTLPSILVSFLVAYFLLEKGTKNRLTQLSLLTGLILAPVFYLLSPFYIVTYGVLLTYVLVVSYLLWRSLYSIDLLRNMSPLSEQQSTLMPSGSLYGTSIAVWAGFSILLDLLTKSGSFPVSAILGTLLFLSVSLLMSSSFTIVGPILLGRVTPDEDVFWQDKDGGTVVVDTAFYARKVYTADWPTACIGCGTMSVSSYDGGVVSLDRPRRSSAGSGPSSAHYGRSFTGSGRIFVCPKCRELSKGERRYVRLSRLWGVLVSIVLICIAGRGDLPLCLFAYSWIPLLFMSRVFWVTPREPYDSFFDIQVSRDVKYVFRNERYYNLWREMNPSLMCVFKPGLRIARAAIPKASAAIFAVAACFGLLLSSISLLYFVAGGIMMGVMIVGEYAIICLVSRGVEEIALRLLT